MAGEASGNLRGRLVLTLAALLPYWRLLTFQTIYVTDDYFASDIFNGELPGRVLLGRILRHGELPRWTTKLCSGIPLVGLPADPIGLVAFTLLPPGAALDVCVIALLLVAAHGAYTLARRFGADTTGALLAGIAFAGCGYFAAQLKHLSIVATVAWLPTGLVLIDRAFAETPAAPKSPRRSLWLALFGLVFAEQVLCGFPQSTYICALVYGGFALFFATSRRQHMETPRSPLIWLAVAGLAIGLGAASGAVVMLPLAQLGAISDRAEALGWDWATRLAYWPSNVLNLIVPYANGDISNNTYIGPLFFWEDYGYAGFFTFVLAIYGAVRARRNTMVKAAIVMALVGYAFVLGRATPIYRVAYELIPGISMFRFPTRFLIVVELGLAVLAAVGLTRLRGDLRERWPATRWAGLIPAGLVALTVVDLTFHQPRQNPMVPAREWLSPPRSVDLVRSGGAPPRTFTPRHRDLHRLTFQRAHGWADVRPYFDARDLLEPNLGGGFWDTPSADCYAGISARWYVDLWGDHNREESLALILASLDVNAQELHVHPRFANFLRTYGVTHVVSPYPQRGAALPFVGRAGFAYVYRVDNAARARVVTSARVVGDERQAVAVLLAPDFDPDREIVLHDAPATLGSARAATAVKGRAAIVHEDQRELRLDVSAPADGFLLLADTYYPGWTATVDGNVTPIYRANIAVRGIQVPAGAHAVRFTYEPPGFALGLQTSAASLTLLLLWTIAACYTSRRSAR